MSPPFMMLVVGFSLPRSWKVLKLSLSRQTKIRYLVSFLSVQVVQVILIILFSQLREDLAFQLHSPSCPVVVVFLFWLVFKVSEYQSINGGQKLWIQLLEQGLAIANLWYIFELVVYSVLFYKA